MQTLSSRSRARPRGASLPLPCTARTCTQPHAQEQERARPCPTRTDRPRAQASDAQPCHLGRGRARKHHGSQPEQRACAKTKRDHMFACGAWSHGHMRPCHRHMCSIMATAQDGHQAQPCPHARSRRGGQVGAWQACCTLFVGRLQRRCPYIAFFPKHCVRTAALFFCFCIKLFLFLNQARPLFFLFPNKPCQILSGWPEQERYVQSASARCLNRP